jgi:hypothetical protein
VSYKYPLKEFLADLAAVEELKLKWSSDVPFDEHIARYFHEVHGESSYSAWRYEKFMVVNIYVSRNIEAFNVGDLAVIGEEVALAHGKLFDAVLDYAVEHDICDVTNFPKPRYFHDAA